MTLAEERLRQLDNPSLTEDARVLLRCRLAGEFIHTGQYEAAREALGELWGGIGQRPKVERMPLEVAAEVLLQCGALTGRLGAAENVSGAQEQAKDLLAEAARVFQYLGTYQKASEAQCELGACYWRLGEHDDARVIMREALKPLAETDVELKGKIHIRRTLVEISERRYHEALNILREAEPVFLSANDALKGRWHGQKAVVLDLLANAERKSALFDSAVIEYTAAIYHFEQAKHERYCATNLNNLAMLFYEFGRYRDAHEHLDRAGKTLRRLNDAWLLAQVDETRARVFIAEKNYSEANRVITRAIKTLEQGGASALLAAALTLQGIVWARIGAFERSVKMLRHAADVAEDVGAFTIAGLAIVALLEEHGANRLLSQLEAYNAYVRADKLLKETQDAEDIARLRECARIVMRRLFGLQIHDRNFSYYSALFELEGRMIEQALEETEGSITRAAKLLGLPRQTLDSILKARQKKLQAKRTPPAKRRRSIVKDE
jgi:tetratricopeptide (TPR) repeat protein